MCAGPWASLSNLLLAMHHYVWYNICCFQVVFLLASSRPGNFGYRVLRAEAQTFPAPSCVLCRKQIPKTKTKRTTHSWLIACYIVTVTSSLTPCVYTFCSLVTYCPIFCSCRPWFSSSPVRAGTGLLNLSRLKWHSNNSSTIKTKQDHLMTHWPNKRKKQLAAPKLGIALQRS